MAMTQGVSGSFDIVSSNIPSLTARYFYSEQYDDSTGKHKVSITDIQIQSTSLSKQWFPNGTVSIDEEVVGTMDYDAPASHYVTLTAGSEWFSIVPYSGGTPFPWESSEISSDVDGNKTVVIAIDMELYRDGVGNAKFSGSKSIALTPTSCTLNISQGAGSTITVKRNGIALADGAVINYGDVLTITFAAKTGYNLGTHTVNGSTFTSGGTHTVTGDVTVVSTATLKTFALDISAGTGATITVKRNGTALADGATLTYGDVLTITFGASTGYALDTHTVNGSAFTSGNTHTVTSAVTVAATASKQTFALGISAGAGTVITVTRGGTALSDGATLTYGDVLVITFGVTEGYSLSEHTVNGAAFNSGDSYTVDAAVDVAAVADVLAYALSLQAGEGITITVNRTSSPKKGAAAGALADGAVIYHSDVLEITFTADTGYMAQGCTVNGEAFTSGESYTVSTDVTISATAIAFAYKIGGSDEPYALLISDGTNAEVYVALYFDGSDWWLCTG